MRKLMGVNTIREAAARNRVNLGLCFIPVVLLTLGLTGCSFDFVREKLGAADDKPLMRVADEHLSELDQAAFSYADRFVTIISDATDRAVKGHPTRQAKHEALRLKLHNSSSIYALASSPNPLGKLLDMATMVTLNKINMVDEGRAKQIFGKNHEIIERAFHAAHDDIWAVTGRFLKPNEIASIKKVIQDWRNKHPQVAMLAYVKFDDFARARAGLKQKAPEIGGVFDKINEVNKTVETAQQFGERTLFYVQRMPRLLQWQTERTVEGVMSNTDIQGLEASVQQMSTAAMIFAEEMKKLDRREKAIQKHLETVSQIVNQVHGLIPGVQTIVKDGNQLLLSAKGTSDSLANTLQVADQVAAPFRPDPNAPKPVEAKPFDINEYTRTAAEVNKIVTEVNHLLTSLQSGGLTGQTNGLQQLVSGQIDHITLRLAQLLVLIFILAILYRFAAKIIKSPA